MDELIRELQSLLEKAERLRNVHRADFGEARYWAGMAQAYTVSIERISEAKRRMADREPAWTLEP